MEAENSKIELKKRDAAGKKLSLIVPFFNEEAQVLLTVDTLVPLLADLPVDYEILAVDDGSQDQTWGMLKTAKIKYPKLRMVRFSRNFGKEAAMSAGLAYAKGDVAILMDGDLQHDPRIVPKMIELWLQGYEVVDAVKASRGKESFLSRFFANSFYKIFKKMSGLELKNASDYKLLDRKVIDAYNQLEEKDTFFRALSAWLGFKRATVEFEVQDRTTGHSKWGFVKLIKLSISAMTGFSSKPLKFVNVVGSILTIAFLILGVHTLVNYFMGNAVRGFTTVILLQLFIGSTVLISLGLIGAYIDKIFRESKNRPRYIVSESIE